MPISRSLRAKTKQQTRLAFSPLPSSSPAKDQYSTTTVQGRLANMRHTGSRVAPASSPAEPEVKCEALPTPEPSSQIEQRSTRARPAASEKKSIERPTPRSSLSSECSIPYLETESPPESDNSDEVVLRSIKRRRLARRADHEDETTPTRKSSRVTRRSNPLRRNSGGLGSQLGVAESEIPSPVRSVSELGEPETTGDEDEVLVTKPTQRRRRRKQLIEDPFVVDDDRIEYISDDELAPRIRPKPRKPIPDDWLADDDEIKYITSDDELPALSSSRKKTKEKRSKLRRRSRHEQEELEDDLADLRDSDHSEDATETPRTRGGPVTTQRDRARQHFELLKRRRAGEKVPRVLESDEEEEENEEEPVDINNISTGDGLIGAPLEISDDRQQSDQELQPEWPEEDDFVVDDQSSRRLGLPHPDIPLEFTSYASAKPKDLFIHVIEWLVKNRLAPAFGRDDPIFRLALSKVSDQVTAQAGSRLISSAWNVEFKYAILARPNLKMTYLNDLEDGDDGIRTCDACNRSNHPARYDFVSTPVSSNRPKQAVS